MNKKVREKLESQRFLNGFINYNHIEFIEVTKTQSILIANIDENSLNPFGFVHGGLLFGLADTGMGVVARATGHDAVTSTSNITYIKPAQGKTIKSVSEIIKRGTKMAYLESKLYNDKDELVATATGSYFYIN